MHTVYVTTILFVSCAAGNLLKGVEVPEYSFAGGEALLRCSYDLRATRLYSLKWYHNGTEFYRYVPTERKRPINIRPSHKFSVAHYIGHVDIDLRNALPHLIACTKLFPDLNFMNEIPLTCSGSQV
ncbi:uncharacterized protein [Panulirus ornatus]|uniref:uncharacterized protein n=1 Tax=Panulirus ornatus TaxID=150431 RepID=UPI003A8BA071